MTTTPTRRPRRTTRTAAVGVAFTDGTSARVARAAWSTLGPMRVALLAFVTAFALPSLAHAQLAPPPPMQPQPTPAPAQPMWNPFLPQQPQNQPYGQYAAPSTTQQQLEASENAGPGRGLEVAWANVEG